MARSRHGGILAHVSKPRTAPSCPWGSRRKTNPQSIKGRVTVGLSHQQKPVTVREGLTVTTNCFRSPRLLIILDHVYGEIDVAAFLQAEGKADHALPLPKLGTRSKLPRSDLVLIDLEPFFS